MHIGKLKQSLDFVEFLFCARLFFVVLTVFLGGRRCDYHSCNNGETEAQHVLFSKDVQWVSDWAGIQVHAASKAHVLDLKPHAPFIHLINIYWARTAC